jgi:hypothetical protein
MAISRDVPVDKFRRVEGRVVRKTNTIVEHREKTATIFLA